MQVLHDDVARCGHARAKIGSASAACPPQPSASSLWPGQLARQPTWKTRGRGHCQLAALQKRQKPCSVLYLLSPCLRWPSAIGRAFGGQQEGGSNRQQPAAQRGAVAHFFCPAHIRRASWERPCQHAPRLGALCCAWCAVRCAGRKGRRVTRCAVLHDWLHSGR